MHIKKLEISGFKSFVDRTIIQFDHDVTGIVGPNGCGKSNIVDAIRWCMGEQSSHQLRGKTMGDVLFAGSESRKPHGLVEVTITFSNTNTEYTQPLPVEYREYSEIAVTRRLFRDGTSEYLINKTQVRLKDVNDLFLGTGVGSKAYSIVEQGKIGLIVSAKPEDRRLIIEEAAGITKYKHRKKQAESKIDLTKQNLLRVGDIIAEIERNIATLKRQASKARRYLDYRKEHEDLLLHEASHRWLAIVAVTKIQQTLAAETTEAVERDRAKIAAQQSTLEARRAECLSLEMQVDVDQNNAFAADNEVRICDAKAQRSLDKFHSLRDRQHAAIQERHQVKRDLSSIQRELESIRDSLTHQETTEAEHAERLRVEETKLRDHEQQLRSIGTHTAEIRTTLAKSTAGAAASKERLHAFDRQTADIRIRREKLAIDTTRFNEDLRESQDNRTAIVDNAAELDRELSRMTEQVGALSTCVQELRNANTASEREFETAKNDANQSRNRLMALEEVHARMEGVGAGTKALVGTKDPCVLGVVADILEPPKHLIIAFAALLGDKLQTVIVNDLDRAIELLTDLEKRNVGRATVMSVASTWHSPTDSTAIESVDDPGVVGPMLPQLRFEPKFEPVARALVGNALIVEDTRAAIRVSTRLRDAGVRATVVTPTGMVAYSDGRYGGGAGDNAAAGLLEQQLRLREMHKVASVNQTRLEAAVAKRDAVRAELSVSCDKLEEAKSSLREVQLEKVTLDGELRRYDDLISAAVSRLDEITRESDALDCRLDATDIDRDHAQNELARCLADASSAQTNLESVELEYAAQAEIVSVQKEACTERKVEFARVREQANSGRATHDRLENSFRDLESRAGNLKKEIVTSSVEQGRLAAEVLGCRSKMLDASVVAKAAHAAFDQRKKELDIARSAVAFDEAELKTSRNRLEECVERKREHEMTLQKLELELEHLLEAVAERFRGLKLMSVVGDYHLRPPPDDNHRVRIDELATHIDRMGPVNLDAMEEHEKASERFAFFSEQKADLDKALADLEQAIQQMNRDSRRLFRSTFDSINSHFQTVFPRLFRGGKATLALTNPDDLLETGVEIQAQPPGKKVGSIELLSGGEKALTAVSLIFAIFQHKPSPFCLLDEVDAPLDEANVTRFNELVRSMTDRSQFILITHIKKTMQSVDVLYGVTMQEPGVSRLVSVKVNAAAQPKWEGTANAVA